MLIGTCCNIKYSLMLAKKVWRNCAVGQFPARLAVKLFYVPGLYSQSAVIRTCLSHLHTNKLSPCKHFHFTTDFHIFGLYLNCSENSNKKFTNYRSTIIGIFGISWCLSEYGVLHYTGKRIQILSKVWLIVKSTVGSSQAIPWQQQAEGWPTWLDTYCISQVNSKAFSLSRGKHSLIKCYCGSNLWAQVPLYSECKGTDYMGHNFST